MNWKGIFPNVDETNSEAEEVRNDGHTRDGQLQLHSHLDGAEFMLLDLFGTRLSDSAFALALYKHSLTRNPSEEDIL